MSVDFQRHPYLLPVQDVVTTLKTDVDKGLSPLQVAQLREKHPSNELDIGGGIAWYTIFIRQICNAMILVLFFAMALSYGIRDYVEGSVLAAVIALNVTIGFVQEYGAEKKMDALRALSSPSATVLRDGKTQVIPNSEVVPGDVITLKMGDTVPADLRLFDTMNLACDEAALTGEALPAEKSVEIHSAALDAEKHTPGQTQDVELSLGDRSNIAYATAVVRKGRGRGVVVATGMATEVGKIAADTSKKERAPGRSMNWKKYGKKQPVIGASKRAYDFFGKFLGLTEGTPLQIKLSKLAYALFGCALILAVVVFGVNAFKVTNESVLYAISTGIAIIPESLVAVLTITMVQATRVMRKANVVVRDLSALEALGGVTNICSDKTGTLTQGAMIVKKVWLPFSSILTVRDSMDPSDPTAGKVTTSGGEAKSPGESKHDYDTERSTRSLRFDVPEEKLNPSQQQDPAPDAKLTPGLEAFLLSSTLCNLALVRYDNATSKWQTNGEPTEIALQVFSHRFNFQKKALESAGWKQVTEFPFDSSIKRMSVVYNTVEDIDTLDISKGNSMVFTKGAVERILELCTTVGIGATQQTLTDQSRETILKQMDDFASQGQRVLAIACRQWEGEFAVHRAAGPSDGEDDALRGQVEQNLTLLGLAGIYDPPRKETTPAMKECSTAGIKVHMLTGDHPATATAIAKEVGIIPHNLSILPANVAKSIVYKAMDFDRLTNQEIDDLEELPLVIARCAPNTKTRMIEALRRRNAFSAMTGDGVNDAPSLSRADVGIAMGSGSDVAKSASKIVLTDDKFNSIVAAIREGRRMFENIQKFLLHLLASNVGEVILLIAGLGFRDEAGYSVFPISALEILWINMLTSSFPAFGLGREAAAPDVMRKPPHSKKRGVFTNQILADMLVYGLLMGSLTLLTFVIVVHGANGARLGIDCNKTYSESCVPVFRARAAVFAELTWLILVAAWEVKSVRRSMFRLRPDGPGPRRRFQLAQDLYENRFLFWSVVLGMLSVFLTVYIPRLNTEVFKHTAITWEWGLVVGAVLVFVVGVELWKFAKRTYGWLDDNKVDRGVWGQGGGEDGEAGGGRFAKTLSFHSWRSIGRRGSTSREVAEPSRSNTA